MPYGFTIVDLCILVKIFCVERVESVLLPFFPVVCLELVVDGGETSKENLKLDFTSGPVPVE